jgi:hypothetical protein
VDISPEGGGGRGLGEERGEKKQEKVE